MFKTIDAETSTGSCPYCNSDAFKFKEGSRWMFLCHSCQRYMPFDKTGIKDDVSSIQTISNYSSILTLCQRIDSLPDNHRFRKYCVQRRIPFDRVYYTDQFDRISEFAGTPVKDKERLILPFFKEDKTLFGVQGRSLQKDQVRYITLMFDKDHPKLFGIDKINPDEPITIVEGPIDSLFVKNCIAMAGSDAQLNKYKTSAVIALDNEPRNKQIVDKMAKLLDTGFSIVIWPESIREKDINDMVLSGMDPNAIIQSNIYSGLNGKIKLNTWKKV